MKDKFERFIGLFLYTIIVVFIYFWGERYEDYLRFIASTNNNRGPYMIFYAVFPIVIGLIIFLPKFIMELRKTGKWQVDWIKFIAVGIPALYFAIFPVIWLISSQTQGSNLPLLNALYPPPLSRYLPNKLSGVVFGYILLSVLYKVISDESIETEKVTIIN